MGKGGSCDMTCPWVIGDPSPCWVLNRYAMKSSGIPTYGDFCKMLSLPNMGMVFGMDI